MPCRLLLLSLFVLSTAVLAPLPAVAEDAEQVDVGGLKLTAPSDWKKEQPTSRLRLAQFRVGDASDETKSAELAVFKFGASSITQNIQRWIGQYQEEGRTVKVTKGKAPQGEYLVVELSGTYKKSVGPPIQGKTVDVPGSRSYNVILLLPPRDMFFLKMVGPDAFVAGQSDALRTSFGGVAKDEEAVEIDTKS